MKRSPTGTPLDHQRLSALAAEGHHLQAAECFQVLQPTRRTELDEAAVQLSESRHDGRQRRSEFIHPKRTPTFYPARRIGKRIPRSAPIRGHGIRAHHLAFQTQSGKVVSSVGHPFRVKIEPQNWPATSKGDEVRADAGGAVHHQLPSWKERRMIGCNGLMAGLLQCLLGKQHLVSVGELSRGPRSKLPLLESPSRQFWSDNPGHQFQRPRRYSKAVCSVEGLVVGRGQFHASNVPGRFAV